MLMTKRHERGVEGHAEAGGHAGDVAFDGLVCLAEGVADAAHGADEADGGDGPGDVAHHRQLAVETVRFGVADGAHGGGHVLHVARRGEALQSGEEGTGQQIGAGLLRQRLHGTRVFPGVLGQDAHAFRHVDELPLQHCPLAQRVARLQPHDGDGPQGEDEAGLLLVVAQHDVERALRNVGAASLGLFLLRLQDGVGVRAHHGDVDQVDDDDGQRQGDHLVDELEGQRLLHAVPSWRYRRTVLRCRPGRARRCPRKYPRSA